MNNIDLYIQELETSKVEIKEAIIAKGVTPEGGLSSYAAAIDSITIPNPTFEELSVELTENGTYNYTPTKDGYSSVEVTVDVEIPTFNTQIKDVTITSNGETTVTPDSGFDGLSEVNISVEVPTSGDGKPKIYNGFRFNGNASKGPRVIKQIDFSQYDWSYVYDTGMFFNGFIASSDAERLKDSDFDNFRQYFNGKLLNCSSMFNSVSYNMPILKEIPDLGKFTTGCLSMARLFENQSVLDPESITNFSSWHTSNVVDMSYMFYGCKTLTWVPLFNTSNATNMSYMFRDCTKLESTPQFDTSNVVDMSYMFYGCTSLTSVPEFDMSNVTKCDGIFYNCTSLTELPNLNTKRVTGWSSWTPPKLQKVGVIDCDSTTSVSGMFSSNTVLTEIGGFRNLGKNRSLQYTNSSGFLYNIPNISHESLLNIFNLLYDRASANYSILTIKLAATQMEKLSDDDKAIAINKGWSLSS